jgi:hypothetical protein
VHVKATREQLSQFDKEVAPVRKGQAEALVKLQAALKEENEAKDANQV